MARVTTPRPTPPVPGALQAPRPPQRPWRPVVSLSGALTAVGIAVAAVVGSPAPVIVIGAAMLLLAGGWVLLLGLPSPRGTTATLVGATVILLSGGLLSRETQASLLPAAVALAMLVEFGHQLARRDGRPRLVESLSASVTGIALLTSAAGMLVIPAGAVGTYAVLAVMSAVAVGCLADVGLKWGARAGVTGSIALALGAAAAAAVTVWGATPIAPWAAAGVGAFAALSSHALRQAQSVLPTLFGRRAQLASGAASVLGTGVLAYALVWATFAPAMM